MSAMDKFESWIESQKLPPNLQHEMDYYLHEIEREYTITLAEGVWDWIGRHEADKKAGWLNRQDLRFLREGLIEAGVAQRVDRLEPWQCTLSPTERTWFKFDRVAYEYDPD
ncbi:MAG: hypothetical protein CMJ25_06035 [Phycisphaerae bacterium]|nr:hypothetical protein [Phycisphaerae bacterium]